MFNQPQSLEKKLENCEMNRKYLDKDIQTLRKSNTDLKKEVNELNDMLDESEDRKMNEIGRAENFYEALKENTKQLHKAEDELIKYGEADWNASLKRIGMDIKEGGKRRTRNRTRRSAKRRSAKRRSNQKRRTRRSTRRSNQKRRSAKRRGARRSNQKRRTRRSTRRSTRRR